MGKNATNHGKIVLLLMLVGIFALNVAFAIQQDDPLYELARGVTEIVQVNVSIWRIVYVLFEIFSLIFVFLVLPVIVFKIARWAVKEVFGK